MIDAGSLAANAPWVVVTGIAVLGITWFWDELKSYRDFKNGGSNRRNIELNIKSLMDITLTRDDALIDIFILLIEVRHKEGPSTSLVNWSSFTKYENELLVAGFTPLWPHISFSYQGNDMHYTKDQFVFNRTSSPVGEGSVVEGIFYAEVPRPAGTKPSWVEVSTEDVSGKKFSCRASFDVKPQNGARFPARNVRCHRHVRSDRQMAGLRPRHDDEGQHRRLQSGRTRQAMSDARPRPRRPTRSR